MTNRIEVNESDLIRKAVNFSYGNCGYRCNVPTNYMIKDNKRLKRIYSMSYGNGESLYIYRTYKSKVDHIESIKEMIFVDIRNN